MDWDKAIKLIESGDARVVVTQAILLCEGGRIWISFDGKEWEETDSELAKREH